MQEFLNDTSIETGVIIDVDVRRFTADVGTQHTNRQLFGIPWTSPYLHIETGEGINYMPEVGAPCLICIPSDGDDNAFIIGYLPTPSGELYRSNRITMNPGDIALNTRDGNHVILRRGGVVQIGSTHIAQRLYLPLGNAIKDFAQNYLMTTPGGELEWQLAKDEGDVDVTPTRWMLKVKEQAEQTDKAGEEVPTIRMVLGSSLPKKDPHKTEGQSNLRNSTLQDPGLPVVELDITIPGEKVSSFNIAIDGGGNTTVKTLGGMRMFIQNQFLAEMKTRKVNISEKDTLQAKTREEYYENQTTNYTTSVEKGTTKKIDARVMLGDMNVQGAALRDAAEFITALEGAFVTAKGDKVLFAPGTKQLLQRLYVSNKVTIG
jgi:hypothetical protein